MSNIEGKKTQNQQKIPGNTFEKGKGKHGHHKEDCAIF